MPGTATPLERAPCFIQKKSWPKSQPCLQLSGHLMVQICPSGRNTLKPHHAAPLPVSAKSSSPQAGPQPCACPAAGRDAQGRKPG